MRRIWEHDDWPRVGEHTLRVFDDLHMRFPNFRVTMFSIPSEMTKPHFADVERRADWMRLGVHGFYHDKAECREPTTWRQYLPMLDKMAGDGRWSKIFKAPWHGIDPDFAVELAARGFTVCVKTIPFFPFPMPGDIQCSCLHDFWIASGRDNSVAVESHPVYDNPRYFKAAESELSEKNLAVMSRGWTEDDEFLFSEDIARPICLKVNIGCGRHDFGAEWQSLDNQQWHDSVTVWDMLTCRMPWGDNKADAVVMSHALAHLPEAKFRDFFGDVFRVLRPGAVFRFAENDTASGYVWRRPGEAARGNGTIRSLPTKAGVIEAMRSVGFAVVEARPCETRSPHKDVLKVDGRFRRWEKGHTFCVEAIKAISTPDITRASHRRPAEPRNLRHLYEVVE